MQVIPNPNKDVWGSFGRGFAESLPQYVNEIQGRKRLSSALQNLQQGGGSPIQQLQALYGAGATDQQISNILPLLQQQQQQQAQIQRIQGQGGVQQGAQAQAQPMQPQERAEGAVQDLLVKPEHEEAMRNRILPLSPEQLNQQALDRVQKGEYLTLDRAKEAIQAEQNERIARQNAVISEGESASAQRQQLRKEALTHAGFQVGTEAGEAASFEQVPGNIQDRILTEQEKLVAQKKKTIAQAASDAGKQMKEIAKMRNDLKTHHDQNFWDPRKNVVYDNEAQKRYAKNGMLEEFKLDLIARAGMSDEQAERVAYPMNDELKRMYNELGGINNPVTGARNEEKLYKRFAEKMTKNDSAITIADYLKRKGYDPYKFLKEVKTLYKNGELSLTDKQAENIDKKVDFTRTLGDLWYSLGERI